MANGYDHIEFKNGVATLNFFQETSVGGSNTIGTVKKDDLEAYVSGKTPYMLTYRAYHICFYDVDIYELGFESEVGLAYSTVLRTALDNVDIAHIAPTVFCFKHPDMPAFTGFKYLVPYNFHNDDTEPSLIHAGAIHGISKPSLMIRNLYRTKVLSQIMRERGQFIVPHDSNNISDAHKKFIKKAEDAGISSIQQTYFVN